MVSSSYGKKQKQSNMGIILDPLPPTYKQKSIGTCEGIPKRNGAVGLPQDRTECSAANSASSNYRPEL
ncbi:hypothetical protein NQZ68_038067, partial [Dissostichus eleginoides]